jgi:hypothetical protein
VTIDHPSGDRHWTRRMPDKVLRGTKAPGARLSREQIEEIGFRFKNGAGQSWLARKYGVGRTTIWRHLKALGLL